MFLFENPIGVVKTSRLRVVFEPPQTCSVVFLLRMVILHPGLTLYHLSYGRNDSDKASGQN